MSLHGKCSFQTRGSGAGVRRARLLSQPSKLWQWPGRDPLSKAIKRPSPTGVSRASFRDNLRMQSKWALRLITALLWALVAASAVYWGLRMGGRTARVVVPEVAVVTSINDASASQLAITRLLGGSSSKAPGLMPGAAERFALAGVIASAAGEGTALISVDGKPARPFVVGARIAPGYVLKAVGQRDATLADDPAGAGRVMLSLPAYKTATLITSLPAGVSAASPATVGQITRTSPPPRTDARRLPPAPIRREERRSP